MSKTVVTPHLRQHLLHVLFELGRRSRGGVVPYIFSEMHMAVPESSSDDPAGAFDDVGGLGYLDRHRLADGDNLAVVDEDDGILDGNGLGVG